MVLFLIVFVDDDSCGLPVVSTPVRAVALCPDLLHLQNGLEHQVQSLIGTIFYRKIVSY